MDRWIRIWIRMCEFGMCGWVDGWIQCITSPPFCSSSPHIYIFHTYVARPGSLFEYLTPSNAADSHLVLALLPATRSPLLTPLSRCLFAPATAHNLAPPLSHCPLYPCPVFIPPSPPLPILALTPPTINDTLNSFNEMQKATKTMAQTYVSPLSLGSYV